MAVFAGAAANQTTTFKTTKYMPITSTHTFAPIAIETSRVRNNETIEIAQEIGKRITSVISNLNETNSSTNIHCHPKGKCSVLFKFFFT